MHLITFNYIGTQRYVRSVPGTGETEHSHTKIETKIARYVIEADTSTHTNLALALLKEENRDDDAFEMVSYSVDKINAILNVSRRLI